MPAAPGNHVIVTPLKGGAASGGAMASGPAPATSNRPCSMSDDRHPANVRGKVPVPRIGPVVLRPRTKFHPMVLPLVRTRRRARPTLPRSRTGFATGSGNTKTAQGRLRRWSFSVVLRMRTKFPGMWRGPARRSPRGKRRRCRKPPAAAFCRPHPVGPGGGGRSRTRVAPTPRHASAIPAPGRTRSRCAWPRKCSACRPAFMSVPIAAGISPR